MSLRSIVLPALIVAAAATSVASADDAAANKALAETLFRDGQKLFEEGQIPQACRKLEASLKLERAGGTMLSVAICHEEEGLTGSAWSEFHEAISMAKAKGRADREKTALEHLDGLEPKLSKLAISVAPNARTKGLEIRVDGTLVPEEGWGSLTPVNPGEHVVVATAPGKKERRTTVVVGKMADRKTVELESLEDGAPIPETKGSVATRDETPDGSRTLGWISVGVGGAFAAGAVGFFVLGNHAADDLRNFRNENCRLTCDDGDRVSTVKRWDALTWISGGLAVASIGTGVVLLLSSPSQPKAIALKASVGSLSISGSF